MIKNKKTLSALLLILIYFVLMAQEIALNQVLCHKKNGSIDLELAVFSFNCLCVDIHEHSVSQECPDSHPDSQISCEFRNCIDQPVTTAWLIRNISPNASGSCFVPNHQNNYLADSAVLNLNRLYPPDFLIKLSKFLLYTSCLEPGRNTSLRC
ncbi:MAG: hypothetical protein MUF15_02340 [Acidobacteria bacterium]|jgi:hypothetical protein|nr:hypothetical protein [Acidobacteriota bacterium]